MLQGTEVTRGGPLIKVLCLKTPYPTIEVTYQHDISLHCIFKDLREKIQEQRFTISL